MAWGSAFLEAISQRQVAYIFILEVLEIWEEPGLSFEVSTHKGYGTDDKVFLSGPPAVSPSTLSPRGWSSTIGGFSIGIVGDKSELCAHVTRGTIVQVRAGVAGMDPDDFGVIAIGQVQNLRGAQQPWTLDVLDLYSACKQRLVRTSTSGGLFFDVAGAATISTAYVAGAATLEVSSTTSFYMEVGGTGLILITPATGDPFFLTFTGTASSPTRFTGLGATGALGTTAVDAAVGDAVAGTAYLHGHPLDIARKILVSRGSVGNGTYDDYPLQWGFAIADALIDHDDIDMWKATCVKTSTGAYNWLYAVTAVQDDAYGWLASFLARGGFFLAIRQGMLTIRAGQDTRSADTHYSEGAERYHSGISITDADIVAGGVENYEAWEAGHTPEHSAVQVHVGLWSSTMPSPTDPATLPIAEQLEYDLSDRSYATEADALALKKEMINRLSESATRVPEFVVFRTAGMRASQLTVGDIFDLTTTQIQSRRGGPAGFDEEPALVLEATPDWAGAGVRIAALVYPPSETLFE